MIILYIYIESKDRDKPQKKFLTLFGNTQHQNMETIIVQDTDSAVLDVLTHILKDGGFQVYPLIHCEDNFLKIIEETRPHVVMLDYRLKGEKCLEVLRQIRSGYPHLPVIATSCNTNINELYNKAGFDDYIEKPFDIDILYTTLRKHIPQQTETSPI